ncbi:hypothetical protein [Nocardia xishanensis]
MTRAFADLGRGSPLRFALSNRPPWADGLLARRVLAAALTLLAIVLFARGNPGAARRGPRSWSPGVICHQGRCSRPMI